MLLRRLKALAVDRRGDYEGRLVKSGIPGNWNVISFSGGNSDSGLLLSRGSISDRI